MGVTSLLGRRVTRGAAGRERAPGGPARAAGFRSRAGARARRCGWRSGAMRVGVPPRPLVDLALGGVAGQPVTLLHLADQLVAVAFQGRHVVVGQLAPLLLDLALELVPVAADGVPVHVCLLPCVRTSLAYVRTVPSPVL